MRNGTGVDEPRGVRRTAKNASRCPDQLHRHANTIALILACPQETARGTLDDLKKDPYPMRSVGGVGVLISLT